MLDQLVAGAAHGRMKRQAERGLDPDLRGSEVHGRGDRLADLAPQHLGGGRPWQAGARGRRISSPPKPCADRGGRKRIAQPAGDDREQRVAGGVAVEVVSPA